MKDYIKKHRKMKQLLMVVKFTMSLGAIILTEVSFFLAQMKKQMMILILSVTKHILK